MNCKASKKIVYTFMACFFFKIFKVLRNNGKKLTSKKNSDPLNSHFFTHTSGIPNKVRQHFLRGEGDTKCWHLMTLGGRGLTNDDVSNFWKSKIPHYFFLKVVFFKIKAINKTWGLHLRWSLFETFICVFQRMEEWINQPFFKKRTQFRIKF